MIRILAAEDNAMNQLVLTTLLAQVGLEPDDGRRRRRGGRGLGGAETGT